MQDHDFGAFPLVIVIRLFLVYPIKLDFLGVACRHRHQLNIPHLPFNPARTISLTNLLPAANVDIEMSRSKVSPIVCYLLT